ncbi:MAG: hypothetical protein IT285_01700 [Bdellovibrionales bacterium]|nr:hypothetical protein [Bdellovibrionales bacterium]
MSDQKNRFSLDEEEQGGGEQAAPQGNAAQKFQDQGDDYASPERFENDKGRLIDFLQYPREKRKMTDFLEETYKAYEQESVERSINRVVHQHDSEMQGASPWHKPGHIGPLMYEYLNMIGVESAFVSGLQHTKSSLTKTVQQRVDEINTLLRGVGGFNRQIKSSFSRSAVVYLEQEDPHHPHRERVIFTINLGNFELRYPLDESAEHEITEDGRSLRRLVWDEAVNTLAEIVSNTGMKPKYVKNDKNSCIFTMRQHLLSEGERTPDEYFTFDLRYMSEETREKLGADYVGRVVEYEGRIAECTKKLAAWWLGKKAKDQYRHQLECLEKDRDFYVGTHADPRETDSGLMFSINVNTMKDYTVTKDKMQVIMTKYILALSKIAVDKSMDQQVNTVYQQKQAKPNDFQNLDKAIGEAGLEPGEEGLAGKKVVVVKDDLMRKRAAGGRR